MLLENSFPSDIRVEKEADALIKAGYNIYLLCPLRKDEPIFSTYNRINVIRFDVSSIKNKFIHKLCNVYKLITFKNCIWYKEILKVIDNYKIDFIHVHDLPLVATAILVKRKRNIPVIADLHENYPVALQVWSQGFKLSIIDKIANSLMRWKRYERRILKKVNHIITVVEEAQKRIEGLNISPNKISIVSNTDSMNFWDNVNIDKEILEKYNDTFIISYIGGFNMHRGIENAINAMEIVARKTKNIKLLLIGKFGSYGETIEFKVKKLNLQNQVILVNKVPLEKVKSYIIISDVGLIPHKKSPHTDTTIPHKLFQYMLFGKPIIVSNCLPLQRIVRETGSGLVFEYDDHINLSKKILKMYNSKERRIKMGGNGKIAIEQGKYQWKYSSRELINIYENIL